MVDPDSAVRRTTTGANVPIAPLTGSFDRARVTEVRHTVAARIATSGLTEQRREDFVLAINELITNAVRHGGGQGRLRLWQSGGTLHCEVTDQGGGIDPARLVDRGRPPPDAVGGWGLWLVRELTDRMVVENRPTGATVRVSVQISPHDA
jgi:serine/threonine-protein kinase RsbW